MRIAYLASSCIPSRTANSIHVMKMCNALSHHGHAVRLVVPKHTACIEAGVGNPFVYYGVDESFELCKRPWLEMPGRAFAYAFFAAMAAREWNAELVYGRNVIALFFAALLGMPIVFESHSPIEGEIAVVRRIFARLMRFKKFKGLVVITEALKRHYEERWPVLRGRITVVADAADPVDDRHRPATLQGRPGVMRVGYVGNLYPGKGMEVISRLAPLCKWADFHVVGGGSSDLGRWSSVCEGVDNLFFYGHIPPSEVAGYVMAFDVVVLPNQPSVISHGEVGKEIGMWTSPLKLFEYMAAGKAIVASDLPVLREVLQDGRNSLLCDPLDSEQWQIALEKLRDDSQLLGRLAFAAKSEFSERYSWYQRAKKIISNYG